MPIAVVDGVNTASPTLYYVHTDHLGRPIEAMSQSGATVWEALYRPFGETVSIFNAAGFGGIDLRFPGQWFQLESGLAYNWHRHYDATLGRYVQPDPIGLAGGRSLYGYVGQNPLAYTDPQGLFCVSFGSSTSCTFPNGPSFVVPRPTGFPDTLWGENPFSFHRHRVGRPIGSANPADIMRGIICKPTPGNPNPATNDGTQNNAVVLGQDDPVTSYLTSDLVTGEPLVVNISNSNSLFHAGYVVRYVRDGVAYTAGEGNNWMQSEWIPGQGFANELLWRGQLEEFIANPRKYCRCGG